MSIQSSINQLLSTAYISQAVFAHSPEGQARGAETRAEAYAKIAEKHDFVGAGEYAYEKQREAEEQAAELSPTEERAERAAEIAQERWEENHPLKTTSTLIDPKTDKPMKMTSTTAAKVAENSLKMAQEEKRRLITGGKI